MSSLGLHLVWCPKYRHRLLGGRVADRLDGSVDEIAVESGREIVAREVMPDRVHVFVRVRPTDPPAEVVRRSKGRTGRALRDELVWLRQRRVRWSKSYSAASVGHVSDQTVRRYIEHRWDAA